MKKKIIFKITDRARDYIFNIKDAIKRRKERKKPGLNIVDRIILGFAAYVIADVYFAYRNTQTYLMDIPLGRTKRIWVIILVLPIFIIFLAISYFPRIEKRLRPQFRIVY